jgi:2-methylisocitrate lyase-like PEP mutase family enzyme
VNPGLRRQLANGEVVLAAGVFDALSARLAEQAGFSALYLGGAALAASRLGRRDVGILSLAEMADAATGIGLASELPVIVDADSGYGGIDNVDRAVRELERAGAQALHIEDKAWPPGGPEPLVPVDLACEKLAVASAARGSEGPLLIARCDALPVAGLEEAIARCRAYLEAGADALFLQGFRNEEEVRTASDAFRDSPAPLVYLMSSRVGVPDLGVEELAALGYRLLLAPSLALLAAAAAIRDGFEQLRERGRIGAISTPTLAREELESCLGGIGFHGEPIAGGEKG